MILRWMVLLLAVAVVAPPVVEIRPAVETESPGQDVDDPAVWVNPAGRARSLVIGTVKRPKPDGALVVFNLDGKIEETVSGLDRPNNVDVLGDLCVVTERLARRLLVYRVHPVRPFLRLLGEVPVFEGEAGEAGAPMGIALYRRPQDQALFAVVSRKTGSPQGYLWQYRLHVSATSVRGEKVREFGAFSGQGEIEAVAVDGDRGWSTIRTKTAACAFTAPIRLLPAPPKKWTGSRPRLSRQPRGHRHRRAIRGRDRPARPAQRVPRLPAVGPRAGVRVARHGAVDRRHRSRRRTPGAAVPPRPVRRHEQRRPELPAQRLAVSGERSRRTPAGTLKENRCAAHGPCGVAALPVAAARSRPQRHRDPDRPAPRMRLRPAERKPGAAAQGACGSLTVTPARHTPTAPIRPSGASYTGSTGATRARSAPAAARRPPPRCARPRRSRLDPTDRRIRRRRPLPPAAPSSVRRPREDRSSWPPASGNQNPPPATETAGPTLTGTAPAACSAGHSPGGGPGYPAVPAG